MRYVICITFVLASTVGGLSVASAQIADASALFRSGNHDAALEMLDDLQAQYPNDVDYMLLRAQIYAQQDNIGPALAELRTATEIAPDYEDLWRLRYRLLSASSEFDEEHRNVSRKVAVQFPNATWWQVSAAPSEINWVVMAGVAYDRLDNDAPSWNRQFVEISRQQEGIGRHYLGISRDQRFSTADVIFRIGSELRFSEHWLASVALSAAADPQFSADSGFRASIGRTFEGGWAATVAAQRRNFSSATVSTTTAGVERYVGEFRFAYSLAIAHLHGAGNSIGHGVSTNWYYSDIASVGLAINSGDEAEAIAPGQVLESRVRGMTVSGHRDLSEKVTLRWWLGLHDQGDFYRRHFLGMAVSIAL